MPRIVETIVTTTNEAGDAHIAPLGLIAEGARWVIAPFRPSRTLDNLRAVPFAVASHTDDVRVFAGCLTGRKSWPTRAADKVRGVVLEGAISHWELAVDSVTEDGVRPRFVCRVVHTGQSSPVGGLQPRASRRAGVRGAGVAPENAAARQDRGRAQVPGDRHLQDGG